MPYVFTTSYIPYNKANDIAKIYVATVKEFRSAVKGLSKEIITNAVKARRDCLEVTGIHDVEEGKLKEFLLVQQKYMTKYHDIGEGYGYDIEVRFKITEALEMIGIKMPE